MNPIEFLAHPYTVVLARWLLAGILLVAGISKLFDREGFVQAVEAYQILPARLSRMFALILPYLEIAVAFFLLIGLATRLAAVLALLLLGSFTITMVINLARGRELDCHCFGNMSRERIGARTVMRNMGLLLLTTVMFHFYDGYLSTEAWLFGWALPRAPSLNGLIPILLTSILIGIAIMLVRETFLSLRRVTPMSGKG